MAEETKKHNSNIKDLYAEYDANSQIKPCGVSTWWHRASLLKDKSYYELRNNEGSVIMEKLMHDMAHEKGIGESLADAMKYSISEIKLRDDVKSGSYNIDTKKISFNCALPLLIVGLDIIDNPNIPQKLKDIAIEDMTKDTTMNSYEFKKLLSKTISNVRQTIIHEVTHAKDFAKININKINPKNFYTFVIGTEMHAHKNQYTFVLQDKKNWAECELNEKDKINKYYEKNNLIIGDEIPQEHKLKLNEIIIDEWLYKDFCEEIKLSRLSAYQKSSIKMSKHIKYSKDKIDMSLDETFKMIELEVSPEFLKHIEKEIFTPQTKEVEKDLKKLLNNNKTPSVFSFIKSKLLGRDYE